jgi:altronate dehydratase
MYARTMVGYITHPMVRHCLLLEHGCEKTHNDFMRHQMEKMGVDQSGLGFASIQLDGGIRKVTEKVEAWFAQQLAHAQSPAAETAGLDGLRIGIMSDGPCTDLVAEQLAQLAKAIVNAGGTVVIAENSELLNTKAFRERVLDEEDAQPSLAYGEHVRLNGFHIMETQTEHWVETATGLAATGIEVIIALVNRQPMQTHPFVPMLQVASVPAMQEKYRDDLDLFLTGEATAWSEQLLQSIKATLERTYTPRLYLKGNVDFQFTRGLLGVSL